jgi:uncharacterized protein YkwD
MMTRRLILQAGVAVATGAAEPKVSPTEEHDFARRIFSRINELRELHGSVALRWSNAVAACAKQQSVRKVELRFPGHEDPERGGVPERLHAAGIAWGRCGENIFMEKGWDDPVNFAVVFWWYSPGHQENMLNPAYTESGVGLALGDDGAWFVTQIFLDPPVLGMRMRR